MSLTKESSPTGIGTERDYGYEEWSEEFYPEPTEEELIEMAERNGE